MLTDETLDYNHIKLQCGHSFNYEPLFKEITLQKKSGFAVNDTVRLSINQIKCPYCRHVNSKLLPYTPLPSCKTKISGVNSPASFCMPGKTCSWIFKSGIRKGQECGKPAYQNSSGIGCLVHHKIMDKFNTNNISNDNISNDNTSKSTHNTRSLQKLKVVELREKLRAKNLKVGGNKSQLIDRLLNHSS